MSYLIDDLIHKFWSNSMQSNNNPETPIQQVVGAVEQTIANPSIEQIIADIKTALDLYLQFKNSLNGLHPTVLQVIKMLL